MRTYADTSFLVKLLSEEAGAAIAVAEYRRLDRPRLFYLPLHALEVENAIRQRAFHARRFQPSGQRAQIKRERDATLARVDQYLKRGAFFQLVVDLESAMDQARDLSRAYTDRLGA